MSRIDDFRLRIFQDGSHVHIGLAVPVNPTPDERERIDQAMVKIASRFTPSPYNDQSKVRINEVRQQLQEALNRSIEWKNPRSRDITSGDKKYAGVIAAHIFHPKITFGDNTYDHLQKQTDKAEVSFKQYENYGGIAVHYYRAFRGIVEGSPVSEHQH